MMLKKLLKDPGVLTVGGMMLAIWLLYAFFWITGLQPGTRRYSLAPASREELLSMLPFAIGITLLWAPILAWQIRRVWRNHRRS